MTKRLINEKQTGILQSLPGAYKIREKNLDDVGDVCLLHEN